MLWMAFGKTSILPRGREPCCGWIADAFDTCISSLFTLAKTSNTWYTRKACVYSLSSHEGTDAVYQKPHRLSREPNGVVRVQIIVPLIRCNLGRYYTKWLVVVMYAGASPCMVIM